MMTDCGAENTEFVPWMEQGRIRCGDQKADFTCSLVKGHAGEHHAHPGHEHHCGCALTWDKEVPEKEKLSKIIGDAFVHGLGTEEQGQLDQIDVTVKKIHNRLG